MSEQQAAVELPDGTVIVGQVVPDTLCQEPDTGVWHCDMVLSPVSQELMNRVMQPTLPIDQPTAPETPHRRG